MAPRKRSGAEKPPAPVYLHDPAVLIPLMYPFVYDGVEHHVAALNPPSFGDLELLRHAAAIGATEILMSDTDLEPQVVRAIRWPDVEQIIEAALDLLPPDFAALLRSPEPSEAPPAEAPQEAPQAQEERIHRTGIDAATGEQIVEEADTGPADLMDFVIPLGDRGFVTNG